MKKISVAMATYNGEKYIEQQVISIIQQSHPVDEIIIVDDCSTDGTYELLLKLAKQHNIIKLIKNSENLGYIKNFQKALKNASGKIVFLADQDDLWDENKVMTFLNAFDKYNASVVTSQFQMINQDGNLIENYSEYRITGIRNNNKKEEISRISTIELILKNRYPGCTCALTD